MLRRRLIALCALPLLATSGCEKDTPEPEAAESKKSEESAEPKKEAKADSPAPEGATKDAPPPSGIGVEAAAMIQTATAAAAAAPHLDHENILGHFMMGNAVESVKEIKEQVAPPAQAGFVDVEALKSLASMQMGERSMVAINLDLNKPFGCALVDTKVTEVPVACVVAYKGGAEALVKDMGAKDKVADAKGHVAAYEIEGQTIYVDALGDNIGLSNHPELFEQAKDYLETNIVGRADKAIADFEVMVYPNAAMERYADEVADLGKFFDEVSKGSPTGPTDIKKTIAEMDQFALGLGLTPAGAHFSVATHAKPGSDLATRFDTTYSGRMDVDFVSKLPMSTFVFAGMQTGKGILENDAWTQAVTAITDHPACARERDTPAPIPRVPPVTTAVFTRAPCVWSRHPRCNQTRKRPSQQGFSFRLVFGSICQGGSYSQNCREILQTDYRAIVASKRVLGQNIGIELVPISTTQQTFNRTVNHDGLPCHRVTRKKYGTAICIGKL